MLRQLGAARDDTSIRILIGKESVPIQLAQCWFHGLAVSDAKKSILCFLNKIYGSKFIIQHSETVMVSNYQNVDCSLKNKSIVSFVIILFSAHFRSLLTLTYGAVIDTHLYRVTRLRLVRIN